MASSTKHKRERDQEERPRKRGGKNGKEPNKERKRGKE